MVFLFLELIFARLASLALLEILQPLSIFLFILGGETIKQINQQTGAHCELDRRNQSNENEKIFIIRGNPDQVEHAKRIFSEKLGLVCSMKNILNTNSFEIFVFNH